MLRQVHRSYLEQLINLLSSSHQDSAKLAFVVTNGVLGFSEMAETYGVSRFLKDVARIGIVGSEIGSYRKDKWLKI